MEASLHFFDGSTQAEEEEIQGDDEPTASDDFVDFSHGSESGKEAREGPSSKTPQASKTSQGKPTPSYHETSPTDVAGYDQESAYDSALMMNKEDSIGLDQGSPATTTTANREFDTIVRESALLLDKKLDNNRVWVQRLLHEMSVYAQTLSDVHKSYSHIQELEHNESQRLDQVEPEVQGATSHLLDNPFMAGVKNQGVTGGAGPTTLGSKRKADKA
jgi:hypothetical protein